MMRHVNNNETGAILVVALMLLTALIAVVAVCEAVFPDVLENHRRYTETLSRLKRVEQALLGNSAQPDFSETKSSGTGFINDYGKPDDTAQFGFGTDTDNFTDVLLDAGNVPTWPEWSFGTVHQNWAGYRGERYLIAPPDEWGESISLPDRFLDGWGGEILTEFVEDTNGKYSVVKISSLGSDGASGGMGAFKEDIVYAWYWQQGIFIIVSIDASGTTIADGTGIDVEGRVVYPRTGELETVSQTETITITSGQGIGVFDFDATLFPSGRRKVDITLKTDCTAWDGPGADTLIRAGTIRIPAQPAGTNAMPAPPGKWSAQIRCTL